LKRITRDSLKPARSSRRSWFEASSAQFTAFRSPLNESQPDTRTDMQNVMSANRCRLIGSSRLPGHLPGDRHGSAISFRLAFPRSLGEHFQEIPRKLAIISGRCDIAVERVACFGEPRIVRLARTRLKVGDEGWRQGWAPFPIGTHSTPSL
jgi:hypothetical protein